MEARIIGLRGCGKSTLMGALAEGRMDGEVTTVKLGDARVRRLSEIFRPRKTTFVEFRVREVPWPQATGRKGEMERYLDALVGGQVFLHVLRGFDNPWLSDTPDPERDLAILDHEFLLADLMKVERALERAKKQPLSDNHRRVLEKCKESLEAEIPLRMLVPDREDSIQSREELRSAPRFDQAELDFLRGYQFLTLVPQVLLLNSSGDSLMDTGAAFDSGRTTVAFPLPEALEVARLSPAEQIEFAGALGLPGPAADVVTQAAYSEMGLISFLTTGEDEVRAWPIRRGATAREAAGAIHSDIQRGFIRAEVTAYDDFKAHPTTKACREAGLLRVEGKDYPVADGDIINFRFNV